MNFFQLLLCNQYADIKKRGGDASKSQLNTLLLSTVLITLLIVSAFVLYGRFNHGFLNNLFKETVLSGKPIGKLAGVVIGVPIFILLKLVIGKKEWYNKTIDEFNGKSEEEQKSISKKGITYFFIASIPVIVFMIDAIFSVF